MAKLGINTGTTANDGTGDSLRVAGGKINTNFDEVYSLLGDGTTLNTGIVTSITAGNFISISTSFGDVTITGLANTENITAETLLVTGISTLGIVTDVLSLGSGPIYTDRLESTGAVIGNTLVGDGSQITGLATTERVVTTSLVVSGITTLGIVTNVTSIKVGELYATNITGDGTGITNIQYSEVAGIATFATNSGVSSYSDVAGIATFSTSSGISTHATTAGVSSYTSSWIVGEDPTNNSHYRFTGPGITTDQDDPEFYLVRGGVYRFTNQMGRHPLQFQTTVNGSVGTPYTDGVTNTGETLGDTIWNVQFDAPNQLYYQCQSHNNMGGSIRILDNDSDFAGYADVAGIATYSDNAGIATYASNSGIATFATNSGLSTNATFAGYSDVAGIATYAPNAGLSTNATFAGYATTAGIATYAPNAGLSTNSTFAGYADVAGIATYSDNAGIATYSDVAGIATYAPNAGIATYAPNAGLSTNATFAGYATTAGISTVSVTAQGLTGTPDISVGEVGASGLIVSGVSTLGIVTGATYYGNGSNLTSIQLDTLSKQTIQSLVVTGVSTLGIVTDVQSLSANQLYGTKFTGAFSGDGTELTGVTAEGSVGLALDGSPVGSGFTQIDLVYGGSLESNFVSIGGTGRFTVTGVANTSQTRSDSLIVTGISTLGIITGSPSIQVNEIYGNNFTGNSASADKVKTESQSIDADYNITLVDSNNGSPTNETVYTEGSLTYNTLKQTLSVPKVSVSSSVTASNFYGDGSGITGVIASGTGINISDSGSVIGVAGTINFGTNLSVSPVSAGVVTVTAASGSGSTDNVSTNSLVVVGVSTLASVTVTSISGDGSGLTGLGTFSGNYGDLSGTPTIPSNTSDLNNDSGFITNQVVGIITAVGFRGNGSELVSGRWTLGAVGSDHYTFTGIGFTQTGIDPDFYLARGRTYQFVNPLNAHPFQIQDTPNGTIGNPYNNGVTDNGSQLGTVEIEVPFNAPDTLYYQCTSHTGMGGTIFIYPTLR